MHGPHVKALTMAAASAAVFTLMAAPVTAAELPKATQKVLKAKGLSADVLKGLDKDLAVPQKWVDAAKKEGTLRIRLNLSEQNFNRLIPPFHERYPYIKTEYTRAVGVERAVKPLLAFKAGRYVADITMGFSGKFDDYMAAKALAYVGDMPSFKNVPAEYSHPKGLFTSYNITNWCTSYNLKTVKKADLPKTWVELVENPRWHNGKVGVANRPQLWLIQLWGENGEKWAIDYMQKFYGTLKPQLRKEAINGMMKMASIGEFDLAMPSAGYRVKIFERKGTKIGFHCPEPVPTSSADIMIFDGGPRINSARIFVNWLISKEGQISLNYADGSRPIHKDLQSAAFLPYPDAVKGKRHSLRTLALVKGEMKKMFKVWNEAWINHGGPARKRRKKR